MPVCACAGGKSTQVPRMLLEADPAARIVITTPTRKAAVNLARTVAAQLGVKQSVPDLDKS
jgi:HrpA-like RNA helicase